MFAFAGEDGNCIGWQTELEESWPDFLQMPALQVGDAQFHLFWSAFHLT
jgi:hypothetical protein